MKINSILKPSIIRVSQPEPTSYRRPYIHSNCSNRRIESLSSTREQHKLLSPHLDGAVGNEALLPRPPAGPEYVYGSCQSGIFAPPRALYTLPPITQRGPTSLQLRYSIPAGPIHTGKCQWFSPLSNACFDRSTFSMSSVANAKFHSV